MTMKCHENELMLHILKPFTQKAFYFLKGTRKPPTSVSRRNKFSNALSGFNSVPVFSFSQLQIPPGSEFFHPKS
jgi:hypothetical protein